MRFYAIIAVLAAGWVACAPGGPKWRKLGPGGGGALFYPTISPHNTNTVLVGCDMTGSYISGDAGESWRMFNLRSRAAAFGGRVILHNAPEGGALLRLTLPAAAEAPDA